eukprot:902898-Pyramimonas_sp.AAC.1
MERRCPANHPDGAFGGASYRIWGHETCEGCAEMGRRCHANHPAGAFGGVPYGAVWGSSLPS